MREVPSPLPLTPGQQRHVGQSLRQLDADIKEAVEWFRQRSLPEDVKARILSGLEAVTGRVEDMAGRLELSLAQQSPDPARKLTALAGYWWGLALDCRSQALRGYGDVDPEAARVLDPLVGDLAAELLRLPSLMGPPPDE